MRTKITFCDKSKTTNEGPQDGEEEEEESQILLLPYSCITFY